MVGYAQSGCDWLCTELVWLFMYRAGVVGYVQSGCGWLCTERVWYIHLVNHHLLKLTIKCIFKTNDVNIYGILLINDTIH